MRHLRERVRWSYAAWLARHCGFSTAFFIGGIIAIAGLAVSMTLQAGTGQQQEAGVAEPAEGVSRP